MTDIDLFGPGAAGAARALAAGALPSGEITNPDASDTFFGDCVANTPGTGTPIVSTFLNRLTQQMRRTIRNSGVGLNNLDDDMLGKAIQSLAGNWAGSFGGAVNAYTATLTPAPLILIPGTIVNGVVPTGGTNTGPSTIAVNGLGNVPITYAGGGALAGGALVAGNVVSLLYTGTAFVLLSSPGAAGASSRTRLTGALSIYINSSTGVDNNPGTISAPFLTLQAAVNYAQQNLDLNGQTLTFIATGTFTGNVQVNGLFVGQEGVGSVVFNLTSATITSAGSCVIAAQGAQITVNGGILSSSGNGNNQGCALESITQAQIDFSGCTFGACYVTHLYASQFGLIYCAGSYTIAGGAEYHLQAVAIGMILLTSSATITLASTPAFSGAFANNLQSWIDYHAAIFSGPATGVRYAIDDYGSIYTGGGGANFFPGNSAGVLTTGKYS